MTYIRKPLGTTIHVVALIASAIALAYGLYITHREVVFLSSKEPADSDTIIELAILLLILGILVRIFFIIVSSIYLFTPNIIMSMYKSSGRFILFAFHTIFSIVLLSFIISYGELDTPMLLVIDAIFLFPASISMWFGVGSVPFPWKTTSSAKSEELTGQMV